MSGERDPLRGRAAADPLRRLAGADPLGELGPPTPDDRRAADDLLARLLAEPVAPERRRWRLDPGRLAPAGLALVAVLCVLVLADPFSDGDGDGAVLERAAAAIGDGPVVHLITELQTGAELVDIDSGERRPLPLEHETWFDPRRGSRMTVRVGGRVVEDHGTPLGRRLRESAMTDWLDVFLRDYRDSLRDGSARVLREAEIDGERVYWVRIPRGDSGSAASCARARHSCLDVAVSRETYEPLYVGANRPGPGAPRMLERVVEVETLREPAVAVPGPDRQAGMGFDTQPRRRVDRATATRLLGGRLVWPGVRIGGLRLARLNEQGFRTYEFSGRMKRPRYGPMHPVVRLVYGSPRDMRSGSSPNAWDPVLAIQQTPRSGHAVALGPDFDAVDWRKSGALPFGYLPPAGKAVLARGGYQALLRRRGIPILVVASSPDLVTEAIAALRRAP